MTWATHRETARDRVQRIESLIRLRLAEAKFVAGHLSRPIDHMALVILFPIEGDDAVRFLHFVPCQGAGVWRKHRIGTGVIFGVDVEFDGFLKNRSLVAIEAKHEQAEHHYPVGVYLLHEGGERLWPIDVLVNAFECCARNRLKADAKHGAAARGRQLEHAVVLGELRGHSSLPLDSAALKGAHDLLWPVRRTEEIRVIDGYDA